MDTLGRIVIKNPTKSQLVIQVISRHYLMHQCKQKRYNQALDYAKVVFSLYQSGYITDERWLAEIFKESAFAAQESGKHAQMATYAALALKTEAKAETKEKIHQFLKDCGLDDPKKIGNSFMDFFDEGTQTIRELAEPGEK